VGVWIGINDIGSTYMKSNTEEILTKVVDKYFSLLEHLYNSGVRKFFLIKVPRKCIFRHAQTNGLTN
jgi:hypothetical protein